MIFIGIVFLVIVILFAIGSCIVASETDQEIEEYLRKKEENEKKNI